MSWFTDALAQAESAETVEEGVKIFLGALFNEMQHGGGTTNPVGVVAEAHAGADDLGAALVANTPHGESTHHRGGGKRTHG